MYNITAMRKYWLIVVFFFVGLVFSFEAFLFGEEFEGSNFEGGLEFGELSKTTDLELCVDLEGLNEFKAILWIDPVDPEGVILAFEELEKP